MFVSQTGWTRGGRIPLLFRIRRILLPVNPVNNHVHHFPCHSPSHTSDDLDLGNTVAVTEDNTNLRRGGTLLCELADLVDDLLRSGLEPSRGSPRVGNGRGRNALAVAVHATHDDGVVGDVDLSCDSV